MASLLDHTLCPTPITLSQGTSLSDIGAHGAFCTTPPLLGAQHGGPHAPTLSQPIMPPDSSQMAESHKCTGCTCNTTTHISSHRVHGWHLTMQDKSHAKLGWKAILGGLKKPERDCKFCCLPTVADICCVTAYFMNMHAWSRTFVPVAPSC